MKVKLLSRVRFLATPWTAAHQAPLPMRFSRQEYWTGLPLPSPIEELGFHIVSNQKPTNTFSLQIVHTFTCTHTHTHTLLTSVHVSRQEALSQLTWNFSGKNDGVGCHFLLLRIILAQGLNARLLCLLLCRQFLYHWITREAPIYRRSHQTWLRVSKTKMVWEDRARLTKLSPVYVTGQASCYLFSCGTKDGGVLTLIINS